jgi:SpoVK/Ycf46/Vps4 family AAA+-type ATPase
MKFNELRVEMMDAYSSSEEHFSKEEFHEAYLDMLKASKIAKKIADISYNPEDSREYITLSDHYYKKALSYHDMVEDPKRKNIYVMEAPTKGFNDFIGLEEVKKYLQEDVIKPWKSHTLSKRGKNGILVYGPHGVSKTRFVHSLIMELQAKTYFIQPLKHFSMSDFADVEHSFMDIFKQVEQEDNVILFIESPVPYFSNGMDEFSMETSELFLRIFRNELKRIKRKNLNVLLIATTSSPDKLTNKAFGNGLFDDFIRIHLPDEEIRKALIDRYFHNEPLTAEQKEIILKKSQGYVTTSLTRLCREILESKSYEKEAFEKVLNNFVTEDVSGYEDNVDNFEKTIQGYEIIK